MKIKNLHVDLAHVRKQFDQLKKEVMEGRKEATETLNFECVQLASAKAQGFIMGVEMMNREDSNEAIKALTEAFWRELAA